MKKVLYILILTILFIPFCASAATDVGDLGTFNQYLTNGGDIRLTNNITVNANSFVRKDLVIDLNGHTINMGGYTLVPYNAKLTINDSGNNGKITGNAQFVIQVGTSTQSGVFVLNSGTIECNGPYGINNYNSVIVNGGTIKGDSFVMYNRKSFEMNGGEIISTSGVALQLMDNATGVINGGYIKASGNSYTVNLSRAGSNLTVNGGTIEATYDDGTSQGDGIVAYKDTTLTINGGTVKATGVAVITNGGDGGANAKVTINGGNVMSTFSPGIYMPSQNGMLTITGGTITGITGVELRAGTMNITGGNIIATSPYYEAVSNQNGSTTKGAAIAISQHVTKKPINVHVTGGTFTGFVALSEANTEGNDSKSIKKINFSVENGTNSTPIFNSTGDNTIISNDIKGFVRGGKYTTRITEYVAPGYGEVNENQKEVVYPYRNIDGDDYGSETDGKGIKGEVITINPHPEDGYEVDEIVVLDSKGNRIPVKNNTFIMPDVDVKIIIKYKSIEETKGDDIVNPPTGDTIIYYISLLMISIIGLFIINKSSKIKIK